jgi:murein DD-endopeptidase MepM/ murein hydrolase activator NlpD
VSSNEVSVTINGKVVLTADTTQIDRQLRQAGLIGGGAPIPTTAPPGTIGGGTPAPPAGTPATPGNAAPPPPAPSPSIGDAAEAARQAAKMHMGIDVGLSGARTMAELRRLEDRLNRADRYGLHSGDQDLVDALKDLRKTLEEKRTDLAGPPGQGGASGGGFGGGRHSTSGDEDGPDKPGFWGRLKGTLSTTGGQELAGAAGRAVGGGAVGRFAGTETLGALGALGGIAGDLLGGPVGWIAGGVAAAGAAFNGADRYITSNNKLARTEISGFADLSRQYGYDRDLRPSFRPDNSWTNPRFASLGYDATDAARTATIYDRLGGNATPAELQAMQADPYNSRNAAMQTAIRERGMLDDTTSILAFSRTTGLNSDRVASTAHDLGIAGVGGNYGGNADDSLRILKYAITEGLKDGISGSTTLQNLVGFVKGNAAEGRSVNGAGMALFAQLTSNLNNVAGSSNLLRGEGGANIVQNVMNGIGQPKDPGLEYLMLRAVGDPSAKAAGMTDKQGILTNEGRVYDDMRRTSPLEASRYLLDRIKSGENPGLMQKVMGGVDSAAGSNTALKVKLYEEAFNLSPQQAVQLIGAGGASAFASNPAGLQKIIQGQSLHADVQAGNRINNDSMQLSVSERDREMLKSLSNLQVLGNMEKTLSGIKDEVAGWRKDFASVLANYGNPDGSLSGTTGGGFVDPRTVPSGLNTPTTSVGNRARIGQVTGGAGLHSDGTPLGRTMATLSAIESSSGTNTGDSSTGAVGQYQIQPQNISRTWNSAVGSAGGWDKDYLGKDATNPDGGLVKTTAQASAWLKANPDKADLIAERVTQQRMGQIQQEWQSRGVQFDASDVAGMVGAMWTSSDASTHDAKGNLLAPGQLRRTQTTTEQQRQTLSPGQYFDKAKGLYQQQEPPRTVSGSKAGAGGVMSTFLGAVGRDLSGGQAVRETQGFGVNAGQHGYGAAGHNGIDYAIAAGEGAGVHTELGGIYRRFPDDKYLGNYAMVTGKSGYSLIYGHMTGKDPGIADGTVISAGSVIGFQGHTGNADGTHVHFGVRNPRGEDVDPSEMLLKWAKLREAGKPGFSSGGFTGWGDPSQEAGIVHQREHVVRAGPAERYRDLLDRMNSGLPLGQTGGGGAQRIELNITGGASFQVQGASPETRRRVDALWQNFTNSLIQTMKQDDQFGMAR